MSLFLNSLSLRQYACQIGSANPGLADICGRVFCHVHFWFLKKLLLFLFFFLCLFCFCFYYFFIFVLSLLVVCFFSICLVWQWFCSDVAVWCPVRDKGIFLTWQCGVLCVAGFLFWRGSVVSFSWLWKNTQKTHTKKSEKKKQDKQIHLKQSKMNVEEQLCRICRLHSTNPELGNVKF